MEETGKDAELTQIAKSMAVNSVDEQIAHHPELISQRDTLLKSKTRHIEQEMTEKNNSLLTDLEKASNLIKDHFLSLPPEESQSLLNKLSESETLDTLDQNKSFQENLGIPDDVVQAIYKFAVDLQKKEDHEDALAVLKFLIVLNPLISDFWVALGFTQLCLNQEQEALKSFQLAITNDPLNLRAYYFTAYTHRLLKNYKESLEHIELGLKRTDSPTYPEWEPVFKEVQEALLQHKEQV